MTYPAGREALEMTVDPPVDPPAAAPAGGRGRAEIAVLVAAAVGALPSLIALVVLGQQLAQVDPSQDSAGITRAGDPLGAGTALAVLGAALVVLLFAGLPGPGRLRSAPGTTRGAVAQGIGGVVIALEAVVANLGYFYFTGPDDGCTYSGCWPLPQQTAALAAPGVVTGLSMLVMALLVRRKVPWWVRALVPVVVLLVALTVQYAVWDTYLIPMFEGPPR